MISAAPSTAIMPVDERPVRKRSKQRFGERGLVDLTGLIGYYSFVSVTLNVFEVPVPAGSAAAPKVKRFLVRGGSAHGTAVFLEREQVTEEDRALSRIAPSRTCALLCSRNPLSEGLGRSPASRQLPIYGVSLASRAARGALPTGLPYFFSSSGCESGPTREGRPTVGWPIVRASGGSFNPNGICLTGLWEIFRTKPLISGYFRPDSPGARRRTLFDVLQGNAPAVHERSFIAGRASSFRLPIAIIASRLRTANLHHSRGHRRRSHGTLSNDAELAQTHPIPPAGAAALVCRFCSSKQFSLV